MNQKDKLQEGYEIPFREIGPWRAWILPIALAAFVISLSFSIHHFIRDRPRSWDFGARPDVPGQSIYSTRVPSLGQPVPRQLEPLPEAEPLAAVETGAGREGGRK
jgi:hypothetical protein